MEEVPFGRFYEGGLGPAFQAMLHRIDARREAEYKFGSRCMALAPNLDIYKALLRGEKVPLEQLRPEAVKRYGLRR